MRFALREDTPDMTDTNPSDISQDNSSDTASSDSTQDNSTDTEGTGRLYDPSKMTKGKGMNDEFVRALVRMNSPEVDRIIGINGKDNREEFLYKNLSPVGKTFVDALTRLIDTKHATPDEMFSWISRNEKNLHVINSNESVSRFYYLTGEINKTAQAKLEDVYFNPSLYKRSRDDFEYSAIILVAVSSPAQRRISFKGNNEVSLAGLMNGKDVKPAGIDLRQNDGGVTIYGQVQAWGQKSQKDKYDGFAEATTKISGMFKGGYIPDGTTANIEGLY